MNKSHGWTDYQERLGRVIAFIHDHLDQELRLEQLAEVAHLSTYHWHRVYHALNGETIASTVRRLRLQRACAYLANSDMPVARIALKCGYPNPRSFVRAFRSDYGVSPSHYRSHGSHAAFRERGSQPLAMGCTVEIRNVPQVRLAGLDHRGPYVNIGKAFETAYSRLAAQGLATTKTQSLAVFFDDPSAVAERQLRARAGLSLPANAAAQQPLINFELGGCVCAVLRHKGPYAAMRASYEWLYGHWLVQAGREPADLPVFEIYLNSPRDVQPPELLTDICLPLRDR